MKDLNFIEIFAVLLFTAIFSTAVADFNFVSGFRLAEGLEHLPHFHEAKKRIIEKAIAFSIILAVATIALFGVSLGTLNGLKKMLAFAAAFSFPSLVFAPLFHRSGQIAAEKYGHMVNWPAMFEAMIVSAGTVFVITVFIWFVFDPYKKTKE